MKTSHFEKSKHPTLERKLSGSPARGLTLSTYCVDATSTLKDIGPSELHLFNKNTVIKIWHHYSILHIFLQMKSHKV